MRRTITGKKVLITGSSGGIGAATARLFVERGATVIATGRSWDKLEQLREQLGERCITHRLDVRVDEDVNKVFQDTIQQVGGIDILINNAGYGLFDYLDEMTVEQIDALMDTNVMGVVRCTKAVLPHMKQAGSGHIINVASIAGKIPTAKSAAYTASKHAVHGFSHALRLELRGSGILVSAVNPGPVTTEFFAIADPSGQYLDNVKSFAITPERVARAIVSLAERPRMEADVPKLLGIGTQFYRAFPRLLDGIVNRLTSRK